MPRKATTPPALPQNTERPLTDDEMPVSYHRKSWAHYGIRLPHRVLDYARKQAMEQDRLVAEVMREALYVGLGLRRAADPEE